MNTYDIYMTCTTVHVGRVKAENKAEAVRLLKEADLEETGDPSWEVDRIEEIHTEDTY